MKLHDSARVRWTPIWIIGLGVLLATGETVAVATEPVAVSIASDFAPHRATTAKPPARLQSEPATDRTAWPADRIMRMGVFDASDLLAEDMVRDAEPGTPMRVGATRSLSDGPVVPDLHGTWTQLRDGTVLWTWQLEAPGAQALRIHFSEFDLPEGTTVVIVGEARNSTVAYRGQGPKNDGEFWASTVLGENVYVEFQDPTGQADVPLIQIDEVLHAYRGFGAADRADEGHRSSRLLPCQEDVNCHSVDATARDSVGRMFWVSEGSGWVCTGALLNDADPNTAAGYFLTANHCVSTQAEVNTLDVVWFYETESCDGGVTFGPISSGGTLLATSPNTDFSLIRMADDPDAGQGFAAWTTAPPSGTVRGIHHPGGSYKRFSEGFTTTASPICNPGLPLSRYVYNDWTVGITEGGSSGSPLFNSSWQVVGQLYGICYYLGTIPGCTNPQDYNNLYGRFGVTYPSIAGFLNSIAPDDDYEDNDALGQAPVIGPGVHDLRLVDFDDYFTVTACAELTLSATATFSTGEMDLDLLLLTAGGGVLDTSTGTGPSETVSASVGAGDYRIQALKHSGWGGDYTLTISLSGFPDCNTNGTPDDCETDCNSNGTPDECDLRDGTSDDCNSNGLPDDCDVSAGTSFDCDGSGTLDECEADCNTNGLHDDCDIADGTSSDCNTNSIPDECELDCDGNGMPDECDISSNGALDADTNGILDACERIFVDARQTLNTPDGRSWDTAYQHVQDALARADQIMQTGVNADLEILVAEATYMPDGGRFSDQLGMVPGSGDREATFQLLNNVTLAGGYRGLGGGDPDDRDPELFPTILSGDLSGDDEPGFVNNSENSYHVVTGSNADATGVLDGATISGGNANGADPDNLGGGIYVTNPGRPTLTNCVISGNTAYKGGGMYTTGTGSSATLTGCKFAGNSATHGGGMCNFSSSMPSMTNCHFTGNWAEAGGGLYDDGSDSVVIDCVFEGNTATAQGGAIRCYWYSEGTFTGCTISGNTATYGGGVYCNDHSSPTWTDCTFIDNTAAHEGGGMRIYDASSPTVTNCTFVQNEAGSGGGAIHNTESEPTFIDCRFIDNTSGVVGGAMGSETNAAPLVVNCTFSGNTSNSAGAVWARASDPTHVNCAFVGNSSTMHGGALYQHSNNTTMELVNCTLSGNVAGGSGGGLWVSDTGVASIQNCIFWNNAGDSGSDEAGQIAVQPSGTVTVTYSDIQGLVPGGAFDSGDNVGNIGDEPGHDPLFVGGATGVWTAEAEYVHSNGTTTLTDATADFPPNGLIGKFLNADLTQDLQSLITSNGPGTITVWGDFSTEGVAGVPYQINDYRLGQFSPCIDTGVGGPGGSGQVLLFDGADDFATVPLSGGDLPDGTDDRTLEAWIYRTAEDSERPIALYGSYSNSNLFGLLLTPVWPDKLVFTANFQDVPSTQSIPLRQWTHVAVTYEHTPDTSVKLYINGVEDVESNSLTINTILNDNPLLIGKRGDIGATWRGHIDEVRIWSRALNESEIRANMFAQLTGSETDLAGYWAFDEAEGQDILDSTASGLDGTLGADGSPGSDDPLRTDSWLLDLDGNGRAVDVPWRPTAGGTAPIVDMGCYEHQPDCNTNGIRDDLEMSTNGIEDCNSNSVPDSCDVPLGLSGDIDGDGDPDECFAPEFSCVWTGLGDAVSWDDPANWLPARRPDNLPLGDPPEFYFVTIGSPGTFTVTGPATSATVETMAVGGDAATTTLGVATSLTVNLDADVNSNGRITLTANGATLGGGTIRVAAGGALDNDGGGGDSMDVLADVENAGAVTAGILQFLNLLGDTFDNLPGGTVTALSGAGLTISGTTLTQAGAISASGNATIAFTGAELVNSSGGSVNLVGATLSCPFGLANRAGGTITGVGGQIDADITNEGTIDFQGDLTLNGDLTAMPGGVVTATGDFNITGTLHDFTAQGGMIELAPGGAASGTLSGQSLSIGDAGTVQVSGATDLIFNTTLTIGAEGVLQPAAHSDAMILADDVTIGSPDGTGGRMTLDYDMFADVTTISVVDGVCADPVIPGCAPPILGVQGSARLDVADSFTIGTTNAVEVSSTIPVALGGDFKNQSTSPAAFVWNAGGLLLDGVSPQSFEVAGLDLGAAATGLDSNFMIGDLEVAAGAEVQFVDAFDNDLAGQRPCGEALYTYNLVLRTGSTITLDNCRVYYVHLSQEPGAVVNTIGCGELVAVPTGDCDGDGDVDLYDYVEFQACLEASAPGGGRGATCGCFDFDGDYDVDLRDFADFQAAFTGA